MGLDIFLKLHCFLSLLSLHLVSTTGTPITKPGCQDKCGNVSIPYPFGIGDGCFIDPAFRIKCNDTLPDNTRPVYGNNFDILNISVREGEMTTRLVIASDCSNKSIQSFDIWAEFGKFTFSSSRNKFIAIGCDTLAYLVTGNDNAPVGTGCMSYCNKIGDTTNGTCNGIGCCEASIPHGLKRYEAKVRSMYTSRVNLSFNPCSYAFLTEKESFNFSSSYLENFKDQGTLGVPAVVDWTIGTVTCEEAKRNLTNYACGPNTVCIPGGNTKVGGYRCSCRTGYEGNPYLSNSTGGHCQDIDECTIPSLHNCSTIRPGSICTNMEGSYNCDICEQGYHSELRKNISVCSPNRTESRNIFNKIVVVVSLSVSFLLVTGFWIYWGYRKRKHTEVKEEFFKKNGGLILKRLLDEREEEIEPSTRNGKGGEKKHRSVATIYTEKELTKATNNYIHNL